MIIGLILYKSKIKTSLTSTFKNIMQNSFIILRFGINQFYSSQFFFEVNAFSSRNGETYSLCNRWFHKFHFRIHLLKMHLIFRYCFFSFHKPQLFRTLNYLKKKDNLKKNKVWIHILENKYILESCNKMPPTICVCRIFK